MRHLFAIAAAVVLTGLFAAETAQAQFSRNAQPRANNNAAQPNANSNPSTVAPARTQRPWAYSNPKYYQRPWSYSDPKYYQRPSPQYYPAPTPYYSNRPYDSVDQGYGYYVAPWGGQPRYVPPRFNYQPYYYRSNPYYGYR